MFVIACLAAVLAGYRAGFQWGYWSGLKTYRLYTVVYPVIRPPGGDSPDAQRLVRRITTATGSENWDNMGGPGAIEVYEDSIVVLQAADFHQQVAELLQSEGE